MSEVIKRRTWSRTLWGKVRLISGHLLMLKADRRPRRRKLNDQKQEGVDQEGHWGRDQTENTFSNHRDLTGSPQDGVATQQRHREDDISHPVTDLPVLA